MRTSIWLLFAATLMATRPAGACTADFECYSFNPCLVNNRCQAGVCVSDPKDCSDGDECTDDSCDGIIGCVHTPHCGVNTACGDQMECVLIPFSFGFPPVIIYIPECLDHGVTNCDDGTVCTNDACYEPDGCVHTNVSCDDADVCTLDECDPVAGCSHTSLLGCCNTDDECAGDQCVLGAHCVDHACAGGTSRLCDDGDACTIDQCNPADGCGARSRDGFDGLACICDRTPPASCAGVTLPGSIAKRMDKTCVLIGAARTAETPKARKLVGKIVKQLKKLQKVARRAGRKIGAECAQDEAGLLADGQNRAEDVQRGL